MRCLLVETLSAAEAAARFWRPPSPDCGSAVATATTTAPEAVAISASATVASNIGSVGVRLASDEKGSMGSNRVPGTRCSQMPKVTGSEELAVGQPCIPLTAVDRRSRPGSFCDKEEAVALEPPNLSLRQDFWERGLSLEP